MLIVFKTWLLACVKLVIYPVKSVVKLVKAENRLMIVVVQHTFNMNIKSINNLELLLITLLKKETTLLDKFHRLIAYFKAP